MSGLVRNEPRRRLAAPHRVVCDRNWRVVARPMMVTILSLAISGCAVGPNFSPAPAPDVNGYVPGKLASPDPGRGGPRVAGQHFVTGTDVSARWWAAFKSPLLNELVKQAVDHNPNLQSAEAAIKVAQYNARAQRGLFFPQVAGNSTSANLLLSNAGSVFGADLGSVPQTTYSLVTNQLTVAFVPDIWGANFRAVEDLDAVTEQQLFQLEAAYLALTSNVVTAAIQEASLRGQIGATNGSLRSSVTCLISSSVSSVSVRWRKRTFSRRKPLSQRLNNCFHLLRNS